MLSLHHLSSTILFTFICFKIPNRISVVLLSHSYTVYRERVMIKKLMLCFQQKYLFQSFLSAKIWFKKCLSVCM